MYIAAVGSLAQRAKNLCSVGGKKGCSEREHPPPAPPRPAPVPAVLGTDVPGLEAESWMAMLFIVTGREKVETAPPRPCSPGSPSEKQFLCRDGLQ